MLQIGKTWTFNIPFRKQFILSSTEIWGHLALVPQISTELQIHLLVIVYIWKVKMFYCNENLLKCWFFYHFDIACKNSLSSEFSFRQIIRWDETIKTVIAHIHNNFWICSNSSFPSYCERFSVCLIFAYNLNSKHSSSRLVFCFVYSLGMVRTSFIVILTLLFPLCLITNGYCLHSFINFSDFWT